MNLGSSKNSEMKKKHAGGKLSKKWFSLTFRSVAALQVGTKIFTDNHAVLTIAKQSV